MAARAMADMKALGAFRPHWKLPPSWRRQRRRLRSDRPADWRCRNARHEAASGVGGADQYFVREVGVALRRFDVGMEPEGVGRPSRGLETLP